MRTIRQTREGLIIPAAWVKDWGKPVSVQRSADVVILESPAREATRKRLVRMIRKLRKGAPTSNPLNAEDSAAVVDEVRAQRAGRR